MANALGVVVVDEIQARIADGSIVTPPPLPIGYITSMEAGGTAERRDTGGYWR